MAKSVEIIKYTSLSDEKKVNSLLSIVYLKILEKEMRKRTDGPC